MQLNWNDQFSSLGQGLVSSEIREILKLLAQPNMISFAGGIPASELFPYDEIRAAYERIMTDETSRAAALQYSITEGYPPLRELIYEELRGAGIKLSLNNICITSGSQQALSLISQIFIDEGAPVVVEKPSYLGALQAFNTRNPRYLTVGIDEDGLIVDDLEPLFQQQPRFLYTVPIYQNPSGVTLSQERRLALIRLAHQYNVPIVEDNAYIALRYEGEEIPSILELDARMHDQDIEATGTIYLGSVSKILAPGFRVAWAVGPEAAIQKMVMLKQSADLHSSTMNQMLAYELLRAPFFADHLQTMRRTYNERREVMLQAIADYFPPEVYWSQPTGGMFIWVELPPSINTKQLLQQAVEESRIAFVPGSSFFADRTGQNTLRLSFVTMPPDKIIEGIQKLGAMLTRILQAEPVASV